MPEQMSSDDWRILRELTEGSDDGILERLGAIYARGGAAQPRHHHLWKPEDPTEVTFLAALARGFTEEERGRWAASRFCARLLKFHWRRERPSPAVVVLWEAGALTGFEAAAMKEHLEEPEGQRNRLIASCIRDHVLFQRDLGFDRPPIIRPGEDLGEPITVSPGDLARAREAFQRLVGNVRPVVGLWRFRLTRDKLGKKQKEVQSLEDQLQAVRARSEELSAEAGDLRTRLEAAVGRMRRADGLADEPRASGGEEQPKKTGTEKGEASAEVQRLVEQLATVELDWEDTRVSRGGVDGHLKQEKAVVERLQQECADRVAALPQAFRHRISPDPVSDWLTTSYPTFQEVTALLAAAYPALQHVQDWQAQTSPEALADHLLVATGHPALRDPVLKAIQDSRHPPGEDALLRVWALAEKFIRQLEEKGEGS
jgi:hypothetical protein